jgi:Tfp pilus assembly protein PilO
MEKFNSKKKIINWQTGLALLLIVAVVIIFITLLWPSFNDLQDSKVRVEEKKMELQSKEIYFSNLAKAKESLQEKKSEFTKISSVLPERPSLPSLFRYLQETVSSSGLIFKEISSYNVSKPKDSEGDIQEIHINLEAIGTYNSFKGLISTFENSSKIIEVENISFSGGGTMNDNSTSEDEILLSENGQESFSFKIKIKTYSY